MTGARASFVAGARDISPLIPAGVSFGLVAGAAVVEAGLGPGESVALSLAVYGGAAQLAATVLWSEGAPLLVVIATALVINTRFFIYSASIAPAIASGRGRSLLRGYLLRDGAYALTMARRGRDERGLVAYYMGAAATDWVVWIAATTAGALGAGLVPGTWSLDFVVTLVFVALLVNALRGRTDVEAAVASAVAATVLVPLLPVESGLVAAILVGIVWGAARDWRRDRIEEAAA